VKVLLNTIVEHVCLICGAKGSALYLLHNQQDGLELKVTELEILS